MKNLRSTVQSLLCLILLLNAFICLGNDKGIKGKLLSKTPVIDGKINPEEWSQADRLKLIPDDKTKKIPQVYAWIAYSQNGIYLAVDCPQNTEPRSGSFADAYDLFKVSDTIEFFICPGKKTNQYLHLAVNPAGVRYDALGYDNAHDIQWETKTSRTENGWQVEVFIPFAGMGFTDPLEKTWSIQVAVNYKHPEGSKILARWPGGNGSFHQKKNFGSFGPLRAALHLFGDSAQMGKVQALHIGQNPIKLQIRNFSGRAKTVRLTAYSKGAKAQSVQEILPDSKTCTVTPSIKLEALESVRLDVELLDSEGRVLFCSPSRILPPAKSKLQIILTKPAYRNTIYSSYPVKQIKLDVKAAFDATLLKDKNIKIQLFRVGGIIPPAMAEVSSPANPTTKFTLDNIGDLPVGDYAIVATLIDKNGKVDASTEELLHKIPAAKKGNEVIFDEHNRLLLNGKPFFTLAAFMDNLGTPMASCDKAWNTVCPSGYGVKSPTSRWFKIYKQRLDQAHRSKRKMLIQLNGLINKWDDPKARYACRMAVKYLSSHPALLAWVVEEEANIRARGDLATYEGRLKRIAEDFRSWDPYHPVIGVVSPNGGRGFPDFEIYGPMTDATGIDVYPIPRPRTGEDISKVAEGMQIMESAVEGRKPVWFVPQIAGWRHYREPTYEEMRCMFLGAIITGARGMIAFAIQYPMWTEKDGNKDMYLTKKGLDECNRLARNLQPYFGVFNGIDHPVSCDMKNVYAVIKETPEGKYLLVANMTYKDKQVEMTSKSLNKYTKAVYKGKSIPVEFSGVKDKLAPLECKIYKLEK